MTRSIRIWKRQPLLLLSIAASFALPIAVGCSVYSAFEISWLAPLPFLEPDSLVLVYESVNGRPFPVHPLHYPAVQESKAAFVSTSAYADAGLAFDVETLRGPERVRGVAVDEEFFRTLGVSAHRGRLFLDSDSQAHQPVALIGFSLWSRLGRNDRVLGHEIDLNHRSYTVIGILPPRFQFPSQAEVWTLDPMKAGQAMNVGIEVMPYWSVVARLRPGVNPSEAQSLLKASSHSDTGEDGAYAVLSLPAQLRAGLSEIYSVLFVSVVLIAVIAVVNAAHLTILLAARRQADFAVRSALGATRSRVAADLLREGLVPTVLGTVAGLTASTWLLSWIGIVDVSGQHDADLLRLPSSGTILIAFSLAMLSALAAGFLAQRHLNSRELSERLQGMGRGRGRLGVPKVQNFLVAGEVAISLVLAFGSLLMLRSIQQMLDSPLGIQPESVLTARLTLSGERYRSDEHRSLFFGSLIQSLNRQTGVSASAIDSPPLAGGGFETLYRIEGEPMPENPLLLPKAICSAVVGPYFETLGIRLIRGREISDQDPTPAIVIDERFAQRHWPGQDPIGKQVWIQGIWRKIIGVVEGVQHAPLTRRSGPQVYLTYAQSPFRWPSMTVAIHSRSGTADAISRLRRALDDLDPSQPMESAEPLTARIERSYSRQHLALEIIGTFAVAGLLLGILGIYSTLSFAAIERRGEIGIRLALGARPRQILTLILRQGLAMAGMGILCGIGIGLILSRFLGSLLYGISPLDAWSLVWATVLVLGLALLACLRPALQAARLAPDQVIRA